MTNSCPGPGPHLQKLYARSNVELLTILMSWTPKGHRRLSGKRLYRRKILATFQAHNPTTSLGNAFPGWQKRPI